MCVQPYCQIIKPTFIHRLPACGDIEGGRRLASFRRLRAKTEFDRELGTWGALEIGARLSTLDLNDDDVRGGYLTDFTLGLNWYMRPHIKWLLNAVYARVLGDARPARSTIQVAALPLGARVEIDALAAVDPG